MEKSYLRSKTVSQEPTDKQLRVRRRAEQIRTSRASRAKKTPDRRGAKQTEELAELRRDGRQAEQDRYRQR
jgi:hypothetical protein